MIIIYIKFENLYDISDFLRKAKYPFKGEIKKQRNLDKIKIFI